MKTDEPKLFNITIVGGGGYIGFHVGAALRKQGHYVTLFDISQPDPLWLDLANLTEVPVHIGDTSWSDGQIVYTKKTSIVQGIISKIGEDTTKVLKFVRGSLLDEAALDKVLAETDCVIHCASYGMSGKEQMPSQWSLTELVNITGTENVLKACQVHGVRGLVYTSSFNVIFGGQQIINGDESLPYFPLHQHTDHYSRTKAIAERIVLFADNLGTLKTKSGTVSSEVRPLRTTALRLAGVMGLGDKRHLPRIIDYFDLMLFRYGYGDNSLQQFSTIRNVVQAHVKAAEHLLAHPDRLGGQAYFVSDGTPINSFEFIRPLREALGYKQPTLSIPMWVIWTIVYLIQATHTILSSIHPSLSFNPILAPAEVYKTAVTHYFSNEKAQRDFGYLPDKPNDITDAVEFFVQESQQKRRKSENISLLVKSGIYCVVFVALLLLVVYSTNTS